MKKTILLGLMGLGLMGFAVNASATLIFNLGGCDLSSDSSTGSCGGSGADLPWDALTMTFEQNSINTVRLTIDASGMPLGTGKIKDVWFNSSFDFGALSFNWESGVVVDDIIPGGNVFAAVGSFDINFEYGTSGSLGDLYSGQTSVYDITGTGLIESDFSGLSTGGYNAVMHVNVTGNGESGHYVPSTPVPEPATMLLFGAGLIGLAGLRQRKK